MKKNKIDADLERYPQIQMLYNIPKEEWPRIRYEIQSIDEWPKELGEPPTNVWERWCISDAVTFHIEAHCGIKACYRYDNVVEGGYPAQMFDDWWDSLEDIEKKCKEPDESPSKRLRKQCAPNNRNYRYFPIVGKLFTVFRLLFDKKV